MRVRPIVPCLCLLSGSRSASHSSFLMRKLTLQRSWTFVQWVRGEGPALPGCPYPSLGRCKTRFGLTVGCCLFVCTLPVSVLTLVLGGWHFCPSLEA